MTIDPNVVMWVFGIVFVSFTGLVGVIWTQINRRIAVIEDCAKEDRLTSNKLLDGIFRELRAISQSQGEVKVHIAENFMSKAECQRVHSA